MSRAEKYEPLRAYLAGKINQHVVRLTFEEIEGLLGDPLPDSAHRSFSRWWTNEENASDFPQSTAWLGAGFAVAAVGYQTATSGWVEFVRGLQRWPGVQVCSDQLSHKPVDERFRELALGYLQSAMALCILLGEHPDQLSWPRASVVRFCYLLAIELFLKSCILHRMPVIEKCTHDISNLHKEYLRLYPQQDFAFDTPYDISLDDLEDMIGEQVALVEDFEYKPDQVFRYLSDKKGSSPKGLYFFSPGGFLSACEKLEADIHRIWGRIREIDGLM